MRRGGYGPALGLLALGLVLTLAPWPESWVEVVYLGALLPAWSAVSSRLVDAVGVSLSGLLLIALLSLPLLALALAGRPSLRGVIRLLAYAGGVLALLFPLTFGLGYRLPPLTEQVATAPSDLRGEALQITRERVLRSLWSSSAWVRDGPAKVPAAEFTSREVMSSASACVAGLSQQLRPDAPPARLPTRVKWLPAGLMLRFGFAGVVSPWLLEPHVDAGLPGASATAVALHEFAHSAGFAAEAEAEAVGLVAGLECADQRVAYAAALRLATSLAAALPPEERAEYQAAWPPVALADARLAARAGRRFADPRLTSGATAAYDIYLRSQGEAEGIGEYDRGTELALALLYSRDASAEEGPGGP